MSLALIAVAGIVIVGAVLSSIYVFGFRSNEVSSNENENLYLGVGPSTGENEGGGVPPAPIESYLHVGENLEFRPHFENQCHHIKISYISSDPKHVLKVFFDGEEYTLEREIHEGPLRIYWQKGNFSMWVHRAWWDNEYNRFFHGRAEVWDTNDLHIRLSWPRRVPPHGQVDNIFVYPAPPFPGKPGYQGPAEEPAPIHKAPHESVTTTGTNTIIAIRVQFENGGTGYTGAPNGSMTHDRAYFQSLLNDTRAYYQEVSYGQLTIDTADDATPAVSTDVYTLGGTIGTYGSNSNETANLAMLVNDAVQAADADIDFSQYDSIMIFHAGAGEETDHSKNSSNDIWSMFLSGLNIGTDDGVTINKAIIVPETEDQDGVVGQACLV